jgi:signal transduction histidine kinase
MAAFVLVFQRQRFMAWVFISLCLATSFWCMAAVAYYITGHVYWLRVSFLGVLAIPALYNYYLAEADRIRVRLGNPRVLAILVLIGFALVIFPYSRLGLSDRAAFWIWLITSVAYLGFFYLTFLTGLRTALGKEKSVISRGQILFEIWAIPLPLALLIPQGLLAMSWPRIPWPNIDLAVIIGAQLMLYSFSKYGVLDLGELLTKGMLYVVYLVLMSSCVMIAISLLGRLPEVHFNASQVVVVLALAATSAVIFAATRDRLASTIEGVFFPEKREYRKLIERYEKELEEMRERLKHAERLAVIGELAASIAHDIRNPLGPIKGYTQMLLNSEGQNPPEPKMLNKGLGIIMEEVEKIDERVARLLAFASPAMGAASKIMLYGMVEQTLALFKFNPIFSIHLDMDDSLFVVGDKGMLESALYNLILNAAQACKGKGEIRIKASRVETRGAKWALIQVSDTGPGIAHEDQERIFEPFFTQRPGGVGLGLSIVKRVVEDHKGWIEVTSAPGQGAVFSIYLPEWHREAENET